MRISALEGKRVALWGFGREGRAAHAAIRRRFPQLPLTLFCPLLEHPQVLALADPQLDVRETPTAAELCSFDAVIKSPGISPYLPPAAQARADGAVFTSGTALWFAQALPGLKLCITGTKGKSTTTALIAHLLRARGLAVGLAGNIGMPLLELLDPPLPPAAWAIELSSYQTGDARCPDLALVLNLFPEHLDWHGSEARYIEDKLRLVTHSDPRRVLLNWQDSRLRAVGEVLPNVRWFGREDGWHLRERSVYRADRCVLRRVPAALPGNHNALNVCAALAAIEAVDFDAVTLAAHAARFKPLPHRLQSLGQRGGIGFIDDSIATTPHASLAALDCLRHRRVAIIVGGFDRGIDWQVFSERVHTDAPAAVICTGQNGERIHSLLASTGLSIGSVLQHADDMPRAVQLARESVGADGIVLLSPGAPSFPEYRDYAERGRHFAKLAGFDVKRSEIQGLGIS
ncbi:MAG: UDP-N-acetylmuramoyl-L-alanine--D-glutamate ligase [Pseudomarimonas sp.]